MLKTPLGTPPRDWAIAPASVPPPVSTSRWCFAPARSAALSRAFTMEGAQISEESITFTAMPAPSSTEIFTPLGVSPHSVTSRATPSSGATP